MVFQALAKAADLLHVRLDRVFEVVNRDRAVSRQATVLTFEEKCVVAPDKRHVIVEDVLARTARGEDVLGVEFLLAEHLQHALLEEGALVVDVSLLAADAGQHDLQEVGARSRPSEQQECSARKLDQRAVEEIPAGSPERGDVEKLGNGCRRQAPTREIAFKVRARQSRKLVAGLLDVAHAQLL